MAGLVAVSIIVLFLGGVVIGMLAAVAHAVRREDRAFTLAGEAPDRLSDAARRLNGLGRRGVDGEFFHPVAS